MTTRQVKWRRGTAAENAAFTGAEAEITVDTTNKSIRVHDGSTAGGFEINSPTSVAITGGTINGTVIGGTTPAAGGFTNITATGTIDGRDVATDGDKLDGIEALADVTDVTNVTAAGALMDSELAGIAAVKALNQGVATTDSPSFAGLTATTADINGGTIDGTVIGGTTAAAVTTSALVATTADINGGTIDGTVIGGTTAAAGTFSKGSSGGITIGDVDTNTNSVLRMLGTSAGNNWQIANNLNVLGLEFTPSTAAGGTTFTTPSVAITSAGNVLVGTTVAPIGNRVNGHLYYANGGYNSRTISSNRDWGIDTATGSIVNFYSDNGSAAVFVGNISVTGSATAYNTSSDYRLKEAWVPMTGASARVQALKPINFAWKADGTRVDGFLAHEAQAVVPESVHGTKDAMKDEEYEVTAAVHEDIITPAIEAVAEVPAVYDADGVLVSEMVPAVEAEAERTEQRLVTAAVMGTRSVPDMQGIDQSKLVPLLTAALQEALTAITDLKARVAALEAAP